MPNHTAVHSSEVTANSASDLAPDLLALLVGAKPHPDLAVTEPPVTVAGLVAAARSAAARLGRPVTLASADGRIAVAGAADLAHGQVRLVAGPPLKY